MVETIESGEYDTGVRGVGEGGTREARKGYSIGHAGRFLNYLRRPPHHGVGPGK